MSAHNSITPGVAPRALFPKGPSFTLENLSSKDFIVKDFIESLSESAITSSRRSNTDAEFDPKPLIRSFEHALSRLGELSDDQSTRETELLTAVRRAELQHSQTLETLGKKLDSTVDNFQSLDTDLNSVTDSNSSKGGNAALRIGEKLEEYDRQARRAKDAAFLVQCWTDVSQGGVLTSLEEVRRQGDGDAKVRCAVIARQLMRLSQRLDPESWAQTNGTRRKSGAKEVNGHRRGFNTREAIEKFLETLEKDLLKQFDDFYRRQNLEGMRECATVLHDFNGGSNVIGLFVNQHQFFIDRNQLITEEVASDSETWARLADPDATPPGVEPSLQNLIDEVKDVAQEESGIIKRAFPFYELVLNRFLQRVFQQSIQQRLEMVLDKANAVSSLAFLRSLQAARSCIVTLIEELKDHGLTERPDPISPQTALALDQQLDDLFVPYLLGSSYIDRERKSLDELYSSILFRFTIFHDRRKKLPTTFMGSLAKQGSEMLASAKDAYLERLDSADLTPEQKSMLLRIARVKETDSGKKQDVELTEEDGNLSVANSMRMIKWLAEGVGRGLELNGGSETPKDVAALLNLLLSKMGQIYVETALDAANDFAASQEVTKTEPDLSYLPNLRSAIRIKQLMIRSINTLLVPLATSNLTVRREMEKARDSSLHRMDEKINSAIQKTIDVILSWLSKLLAAQKKLDYRPRDGALDRGHAWLESLQTATCSAICAFLTKAHNQISQTLTGEHLEAFLTELGIGVRSLLLDHFKKFQVNFTGALSVQEDIKRYTDLLRAWPTTASFRLSLDVLPEIGNIFVVKPEALKDRLRTGALSALLLDDVRPYIMRRDDLGSVGMTTVLNSLQG